MAKWRIVRKRVGFDAYDPGHFVYSIKDIEMPVDNITAGEANSIDDLRKVHQEQLEAFNHPVMEVKNPVPYFDIVKCVSQTRSV